ncbi:right-handed parallel beta-helix repeat-containing protein [Luteolibacter arcticus]|uniref:Right-handed parallel beta-helix repeat-containing protein n=1 Tax=Luteolibacter arcticus TaxID=1581411 RepID=A0ABT3GLZ4_9BACT|nr:right-handed parallel beta-helix repeat-containing protein [Luteolibacter arcticus]MCW1924548.1 right-handed parallel beta-helix repeat-containing protein [Luteolibacter arcticus]
MKTSLLLAAVLLAPLALRADLIGHDSFHYPDGPIQGASGGAFWDRRNVAPAGHDGGVSDWDALAGTPLISGGALVTSNFASAIREYHGPGEGFPPSDEADGAVNEGHVAKAVYYRVSFTPTAGVSFAGMSSFDFPSEQIFFGVPFGETNFGIDVVGVSRNMSSIPATAGQTYTLVAKVDFANDLLALYINPNLTAPESSSVPAVTVPYTGTNWSTAVRLASGGSGTASWDDLGVATTWDSLRTRMVLNAGDTGADTLRQTIADAIASGGRITFAPGLSGQTIALTSGNIEFTGSSGIFIDASNLAQGVTLDTGGLSHHFYVGTSSAVAINRLKLVNGRHWSIYSEGLLFLTDCALSGNRAPLGGSALRAHGRSFLSGCTFTDNTSSADAPAIANYGQPMQLVNCTLHGNTAGSNGGTIYSSAPLALTRCTVTGNHAGNKGGAIFFASTSLTVTNSIISGNSAAASPGIHNLSGALVVEGNNLIQSFHSEGPGTTFGGSGTITDADPLLTPLGRFGGPTMTRHPLVGSPAIDGGGGSVRPTDQRGFSGSVGALPDIGAVEAGPLLLVTTRTDENNGSSAGAGRSLREALAEATTPGHRVVIPPFSPMGAINLTLGELSIPANAGLVIDASLGPIPVNAASQSRGFHIGAGATVAMYHLSIYNGRSSDGTDATELPVTYGTPGQDGGGILNEGTLTVMNATIANNRCGAGGDGLVLPPPIPGAPAGYIFGGRGGSGGAIANTGILAIHSSILSQNVTGRAGTLNITGLGGCISNHGILEIDTCHLGSNSTADQDSNGGAIFNEGSLALFRSTLSDNSAQSGGAILNEATARLENCTLSGNRVSSGGGAAENTSGSTLTLFHCTISSNTAGGFGGGAIYNAGSLIANHTIAAGNLPNNLIGNPLTGSGNFTAGDPGLSPLRFWSPGFPTHVPLPASPVIDATTGPSTATDQRGLPRVSTADIGATEFQGYPDLAAFWEEDFDNDGNTFGIEHALGTDPLVFDRSSSQNPAVRNDGSNFQVQLGFNAAAAPYTRWILKRSTNLINFNETIFTYDGPNNQPLAGPGFTFSPGEAYFGISQLSTPPKAFFRFEAELVPP